MSVFNELPSIASAFYLTTFYSGKCKGLLIAMNYQYSAKGLVSNWSKHQVSTQNSTFKSICVYVTSVCFMLLPALVVVAAAASAVVEVEVVVIVAVAASEDSSSVF